ncbi:MAG: hypothetical protein ACXVD8_13420, partial [Actinomycetota bacterium]
MQSREERRRRNVSSGLKKHCGSLFEAAPCSVNANSATDATTCNDRRRQERRKTFVRSQGQARRASLAPRDA